jgi:glycine hydroxymethyltransferase
MNSFLKKEDSEIFDAIEGEEKRQAEGLGLIPSENYVSRAVREANASVFTNKYAEGYPGKRYYGGQEFTDKVEQLAIERACKLFGCKFANVQPLSGAPANLAVYFALLKPGDTVLGMELSHGGHLTHGHPVTAAANTFRFVRYKMKDIETGEIDYDALHDIARQEQPRMILAGFSAYARELDYSKFVRIARDVGAYAVADIAHIAGLIAGGVAKNPFAAGFDVLTSTTHKTLRGPRGGLILVRDDESLARKINAAVFPGIQGGPHMHSIAAKAVCFHEALHPAFKTYAAHVVRNAAAMADVLKKRAVRMIGGGTSNHLIIADVLGSCGIGGREAQEVLDEVGMTVNKNMIADDARPPVDPSGIRFGTPAMTSRGFDEVESAHVATLLLDALEFHTDERRKREIREAVMEVCARHPIPDSFI